MKSLNLHGLQTKWNSGNPTYTGVWSSTKTRNLKPNTGNHQSPASSCSEGFFSPNMNLNWFLLLGSSARIPGRNRNLLFWQRTTTRAPTHNCSTFGRESKAMWCPETTHFPFSSKLTRYFSRPSSASNKQQNSAGGPHASRSWKLKGKRLWLLQKGL